MQWRLQAESEIVYEVVEICDYFALRFLSFPGLLAAKKRVVHLDNYTITAQMSTSMGDDSNSNI